MPLAVLGGEAFLGLRQVAGHQEPEQGAQVLEGVLHRRAREDVAALRDELLDGLGRLRARVLDVLAFVADRGAPGDEGERADVAGQRPVGGDDQVEPLQVFRGRFAGLAVVGQHLERGREAAGFAAPVLDERSGADHEAGSVLAAMGPQGLEEGERLHGLAEAHLVGQQAAEVVVVDVPEPGHPDLLVDAQHAVELLADRGGLQLREVADGRGALGPGLGRGEGGLQFLGDRVGAGEVGEADGQLQVEVDVALRLAGDAALRVADGVEQLGGDEARPAVRVEEHAAAVERLLDDLGRLALRVDADGETEALLLLRGIALRLGQRDVAERVPEVVGHHRVVLLEEQAVVASEEVKDLDRAGEVPLAGGGLEGEAVALEGLAELRDGAGGLLRQADAQPLHRTIHPGAVLAAAVLRADLLLAVVVGRIAGGVGLGRRDRLAQVFVDAFQQVALPRQGHLGGVGHAENGQALAHRQQLAQVAAGEGEDALQLALAEVFDDRQEEDGVRLDGPRLAAVEVLGGHLHVVDAQLEAADDLVALGGGGDVRRDDEAHLDGRAAFLRKGEGLQARAGGGGGRGLGAGGRLAGARGLGGGLGGRVVPHGADGRFDGGLGGLRGLQVAFLLG